MDENLITKKELLELTGISYGALYRWKRMKLLPDDWFIHRSTFTGHETFFPRDKVLERVEQIQRMKEHMSLDEIARQFSPSVSGDVLMTAAEAAAAGIAPPPIINQFLALNPMEQFDYDSLFELYIFSELIQEGSLGRDEAYEASQAAKNTGDVSEPVIYLLRKYGVVFCLIAGEMQKIVFDKQSTLVATIPVGSKKAALAERLKKKGVSI